MKRLPCILLAAAVSLLAACSPRTKSARISPDGSMRIRTSIEEERRDRGAYGCIIVEVCDKSSKVLYRENTRASATQRWGVTWTANDEFKFTSSDIGDSIWKRQPDGSWKKM